MIKKLLVILLAISLIPLALIDVHADYIKETNYNFTMVDNQYYDLGNGNLLDDTGISSLGYTGDYANNWMASDKVTIGHIDNITSLQLSRNTHYILFWDEGDGYIGYQRLYYSYENNGAYRFNAYRDEEFYQDGYLAVAKNKYLGTTHYANITIPNDTYKIAIMSNKDGLLSSMTDVEGTITTFEDLNNPLTSIILPDVSPTFETPEDLFEYNNTYNTTNEIDIISSTTIDGLTFTYNPASSSIEISGTATSNGEIEVTNSLTSLVDGKFTVEQTWGSYNGVEGAGIYKSNGVSDTIIVEFFDFNLYPTPRYIESDNNGIYDRLLITYDTGDQFVDYTLQLGFYEELGDIFKEAISYYELQNNMTPTFNFNNASNSLYSITGNNYDFYRENIYNDYPVMRYYDYETLIEQYDNANNYEISTTSNPYGYDNYYVYSINIDGTFDKYDIYNIGGSPVNEFQFLLTLYRYQLIQDKIDDRADNIEFGTWSQRIEENELGIEELILTWNVETSPVEGIDLTDYTYLNVYLETIYGREILSDSQLTVGQSTSDVTLSITDMLEYYWRDGEVDDGIGYLTNLNDTTKTPYSLSQIEYQNTIGSTLASGTTTSLTLEIYLDMDSAEGHDRLLTDNEMSQLNNYLDFALDDTIYVGLNRNEQLDEYSQQIFIYDFHNHIIDDQSIFEVLMDTYFLLDTQPAFSDTYMSTNSVKVKSYVVETIEEDDPEYTPIGEDLIDSATFTQGQDVFNDIVYITIEIDVPSSMVDYQFSMEGNDIFNYVYDNNGLPSKLMITDNSINYDYTMEDIFYFDGVPDYGLDVISTGEVMTFRYISDNEINPKIMDNELGDPSKYTFIFFTDTTIPLNEYEMLMVSQDFHFEILQQTTIIEDDEGTRPQVDELLEDLFSGNDIWALLFMIGVVIIVAVMLLVFKTPWLVVLIINTLIVIGFAIIGFIPVWVILLVGIILVVLIFTTVTKY